MNLTSLIQLICNFIFLILKLFFFSDLQFEITQLLKL